MPTTCPTDLAVTRRGALGAVLAVGVAGCTSGSQPPPTGSGTSPASGTPLPRGIATASSLPVPDPRPGPDAGLAAVVLSQERRILDRVRATRRAHPRLRAALAGSEQVHGAHVALLRDAAAAAGQPAGDPSRSAGEASGRRVRVPRRPATALARLLDHEERLALAGRRAAFEAESGPFARVLATMAAAASQQAVVLRAVSR